MHPNRPGFHARLAARHGRLHAHKAGLKRRLWLYPRSIAGRVTLVLIAGLIAIAMVTALASQVPEIWSDADMERHDRQIGRIALLAMVAIETPADGRTAALAPFQRPDLDVMVLPSGALDPQAIEGRRRGVEEYLGYLLKREDLVDDNAVAARRGPLEVPGLTIGDGATLVAIKLPDGAWLAIAAQGLLSDTGQVARFVGVILVFGTGIVLLGHLIARFITRPLAHFAAAAQRLGDDVDAPPLDERGPREIGGAATAFNHMQWRIRRFIEERMQMLAAAAHDLRTPITRLRLRAEFVDDDEQRAKMLNDLDEMAAIINSTLAFAREETTAEPRLPLDLARLLGELVAGFSEAGRPVTLTGPAAAAYDGRPTALRRAFANLIDNAVAYGGRADVALAEDADGLTVTIDDAGPGIPEDEHENVFRPFYRLERSRSRETGGTGLGLAVARLVVREHGGDITFTNRAEGGLRQTVTLPR